MTASVTAMRRQVAKLRDELQQFHAQRPPPGMTFVRNGGVSGMLRQAREDALRDESGNRVPRRTVSTDDPRPASGIVALLWDAKKRHAERQAAGEPMPTEPGET